MFKRRDFNLLHGEGDESSSSSDDDPGGEWVWGTLLRSSHACFQAGSPAAGRTPKRTSAAVRVSKVRAGSAAAS